MKLPEKQIKHFDKPEINETYADSIGSISFDSGTMRIEFCITRMNELKPATDKPTAKRYPVSRMVLSPDGTMDLYNKLKNFMGVLEAQGVIKITPPIEPLTAH